jgi:hypothetical protein
MEKKVRIFNLGRPDAAPLVMEGAPSGIRQAVWFNNDSLILCAYSDTPGVQYVQATLIFHPLPSYDGPNMMRPSYSAPIVTRPESSTSKPP